jgi:serine-type D-Ala-D-Ala carboxypeptidase/endopeptidase (penicillin-binding protein 4)
MGRRAHLRPVLGPFIMVALAVAAVLSGTAGAADAQLAPRLERALRVPHVDPSRTAALAIDLRNGTVVYSRNETLSLVPASTEKLAVAYAALAVLGPGYRFHTEVAGIGRQVGPMWRGNLVLRGYGDPTLAPADLDALAARLAELGIRRVTGSVVGDESWFDSARTGPGWLPRFYIEESPPLSALVVDRSRYRGRTSANPPLAAASLFRAALEAKGIRVRGRSRVAAPPPGLLLARDVSQPLSRIVRFMGRESDNFTAELLVKHLGALDAPAGVRGTTARGMSVVRATLEEAGVPLAGVRLVDGSGLSRQNRITAATVVALLEAGVARSDLRDAFIASLAVAGVDGTLEHRLERRPARGKVIGKTGTTRVASALSGFVRGRYVFAVIQNGAPVSTFWTRRAQDRFATVLASAG